MINDQRLFNSAAYIRSSDDAMGMRWVFDNLLGVIRFEMEIWQFKRLAKTFNGIFTHFVPHLHKKDQIRIEFLLINDTTVKSAADETLDEKGCSESFGIGKFIFS